MFEMMDMIENIGNNESFYWKETSGTPFITCYSYSLDLHRIKHIKVLIFIKTLLRKGRSKKGFLYTYRQQEFFFRFRPKQLFGKSSVGGIRFGYLYPPNLTFFTVPKLY